MWTRPFPEGTKAAVPSEVSGPSRHLGRHPESQRRGSPTSPRESGLGRGIHCIHHCVFTENPCSVRKWFSFQNPESLSHRILVHLSRNLRADPVQHLQSMSGAREERRPAQGHSCPQRDKRGLPFHVNSGTSGSIASGVRHVTEMRGPQRGRDGWGSRPLGASV